MSDDVQPAPRATTVTVRFIAIIDCLCDAMFDPHLLRIEPAAKLLMFSIHINKFAVRFLAILARTVTKPREPAAPPKPRTLRPPKPPPPPPLFGLPTRFGWIAQKLPGRTNPIAQARLDFIALLADPAMIALIDAHPTIGRVLRPLCHALGLHPPPNLQLSIPPSRDPATPRSPRKRHPRNRYPNDYHPNPNLEPFRPGHPRWPPWVKNPIETF